MATNECSADPGAAEVDRHAHGLEHRGLDRERLVRPCRVVRIDDLDVIGLWRAIIWSRVTPWSTACMIGHCCVVSVQRRCVSASGSSMTVPRPMSTCSARSMMNTRLQTISPGG